MDIFSDEVQLHGSIILQLKAKWTCEKHGGEHGEHGYCYVSPTGEHVGLNNRKLKIWAAAIVGGKFLIQAYTFLISIPGRC